MKQKPGYFRDKLKGYLKEKKQPLNEQEAMGGMVCGDPDASNYAGEVDWWQGTSPAECEYPDGTMVHIFGIAGPNGLYSWGAYYPVGNDNDAFIQLNQQVYENFGNPAPGTWFTNWNGEGSGWGGSTCMTYIGMCDINDDSLDCYFNMNNQYNEGTNMIAAASSWVSGMTNTNYYIIPPDGSEVEGNTPGGSNHPDACEEFTVIEGCTDFYAVNYDPYATVDDGSCIESLEGCTNPIANNYDSTANIDDGSCIIQGCMNPLATNYNPEANSPMGSYWGDPEQGILGGMCFLCQESCGNVQMLLDGGQNNYSPNPNGPGYIVNEFIPPGDDYYIPNSSDYLAVWAYINTGTASNSVCWDNMPYNFDGSIAAQALLDFTNGVIDQDELDLYCPQYPEVLGCTDSTAINYDSSANSDDGSCYYNPGCTDPEAINYNPEADFDDGSCIGVILGCTDPEAFNYDPEANTDDGSCIPVILGCTDPEAINYNPEANTDDGTCIDAILGCTDPEAANYNINANTDDGSCYYNPGCTDPEAFNYNPEAEFEEGTCIEVK